MFIKTIVGTPGSNKTEEFRKRSHAIADFEGLYADKTGNDWEDRAKFEKVFLFIYFFLIIIIFIYSCSLFFFQIKKRPGKFYPVDIDYGTEEQEIKIMDVSKATGSKLHPRVQSLISLLFDIQMMKKTLVELEVDIKKMPLGIVFNFLLHPTLISSKLITTKR